MLYVYHVSGRSIVLEENHNQPLKDNKCSHVCDSIEKADRSPKTYWWTVRQNVRIKQCILYAENAKGKRQRFAKSPNIIGNDYQCLYSNKVQVVWISRDTEMKQETCHYNSLCFCSTFRLPDKRVQKNQEVWTRHRIGNALNWERLRNFLLPCVDFWCTLTCDCLSAPLLVCLTLSTSGALQLKSFIAFKAYPLVVFRLCSKFCVI